MEQLSKATIKAASAIYPVKDADGNADGYRIGKGKNAKVVKRVITIGSGDNALRWDLDGISKDMQNEIRVYKGKLVANTAMVGKPTTNTKGEKVYRGGILGMCKKLTCQDIMRLPLEDRKKIANWVGATVNDALEKLTSTASGNTVDPLF